MENILQSFFGGGKNLGSPFPFFSAPRCVGRGGRGEGKVVPKFLSCQGLILIVFLLEVAYNLSCNYFFMSATVTSNIFFPLVFYFGNVFFPVLFLLVQIGHVIHIFLGPIRELWNVTWSICWVYLLSPGFFYNFNFKSYLWLIMNLFQVLHISVWLDL